MRQRGWLGRQLQNAADAVAQLPYWMRGEDKPKEKMNKKFVDDRGSIEILYNNGIHSIFKIISNTGAKRANHFHKTTGHWCVLIYGSVDYYERPVGSNEKPTVKTYGPDEVFWSEPMVEHLMVFKCPSSMICHTLGNRDQKNYEEDLVRLEFQLDTI